MKGQNMGQKKQTKAQRIAQLEELLTERSDELAAWMKAHDAKARDLRSATFDLNAYRAEEKRQKAIADAKKREEERQAERDRLNDLSNGVIDLSKIRHDFGFDYDSHTDGGTVTITLHANDREAKILNAYATQDRDTSGARATGAMIDEINRISQQWLMDIIR